MVSPKHPQNFTADEVGMWLVAIGLGSKVSQFKESGVDGGMLMMLSPEDFGDLGLSSLQGKKLLSSLETTKAMAVGGSGAPDPAQDARIMKLEDENMALRQQLAQYQQAHAQQQPAATHHHHAPAPAPAPAAKKPPLVTYVLYYSSGSESLFFVCLLNKINTYSLTPFCFFPISTSGHAVAGAAGGAARGAIKGAVIGAVLGDPAAGAKAGAAGGAVGGAMGGLGARRRARMRMR